VHALESRTAFNIGAYLGVPLQLEPDRLFGTLCVLDPSPHRFSPDDLDLLLVMSAWLRLSLERDYLAGKMVFDAQ
jgi:GAF domain-containing protein